jgi:hypothetical protein
MHKKRFTIKMGQQLKMIAIEEVECFYSENKGTYLHTLDNRDYLLDNTLEQLETELDPALGELAEWLGAKREALRTRFPDTARRRQVIETLIRGPAADALRNGDVAGAEAAFEAALGEDATPRGRVILVGAGPGDPGLLTLRGLRALNQADVVLHDRLVSPEVLALARKQSGQDIVTCRPADLLAPRMPKLREELTAKGLAPTDENAVLFAMFPRETESFYKPKPAAAAPAPVAVTSAAPAAAAAPAPAKPAAAGSTTPFAVPAGKTARYSLTVNERRYDATVEILN